MLASLRQKQAWRITGTYVVVSIIWIVAGDRLVSERFFSGSAAEVSLFQTVKGVFFVLTTGTLLLLYVGRSLRRERGLQDRVRILVENAADVFFRYRLVPAPAFEYVSPACKPMSGYTAEEHYADPLLGQKLIHPGDRSKLAKLREEFGNPVILRWIRKDGSVIWTEQINRGVFDTNGQLIAIEGVARDVSARVREWRQLELSEERFRLAADHHPDPFIIYDADRRIIFVNPALEKLSGHAADEMLLHRDEEVFSVDGTQELVFLLEAALRSRLVREAEIDIQWRPGGPRRRVYARIIPVSGNTESDVAEILALLRDTTELRIMESQLSQTERLATLGELSASIVHEINQPLSVISMASKMLVKAVDAAEPDVAFLRERSEKIAKNVVRLERLTGHLREFGRADTGTHPTVFYLCECVRSALELVEERMRAHDVAVEMSMPAAPILVCGDTLRLEEVFVNILLNAYDAITLADDRRRLVSVSCGRDVGGFAFVRIFNTGPSIPPDTQARLFEPFFTTKPGGLGMGLGLAISYRIAQAHRGEIRAVNESDGVAFYVTLPYEVTEAADDGL